MEYLHGLRRRWRTVVVTMSLGAITAACITVQLPRSYVASATSFVSITDPGDQPNSLYQGSKFALNQVASYTGLADGKPVLEPVISQLHLSMTSQELATHVSASHPADTVLLIVQAEGSNPRQTQRIANAVAAQLGKEIQSLETPRAGSQSTITVKVAVPAGLPSSPVSPRPVLNVLIGLLLGLAAGASIAIGREQMDKTVRSVDELQNLTGFRPLGSIPEDGSIGKLPLLTARHRSIDLEVFRSIRTTLQFVDANGPSRQVVVTSACSDEGKTITACILTIAMAQTSRRVCLVEGNLRNPMFGRYLGLHTAVGLTDVLAGRRPLTEALKSWNGEHFTVLHAGTTPRDPSRLLGSRAMSDLLAILRERFDLLIIDTPPLLSVSDSAVLSQSSDGVILVVRHGRTRRDELRAAMETLQSANARLIGTILTRVPAPKPRTPKKRERYSRTQLHAVPSLDDPSEQMADHASSASHARIR